MGKSWQRTHNWTGLDERPEAARKEIVDLIKRIPTAEGKRTLNILVVGKLGVGKSSLIKSIVGQDFLVQEGVEKFSVTSSVAGAGQKLLGKKSPIDPNNGNNLCSKKSQENSMETREYSLLANPVVQEVSKKCVQSETMMADSVLNSLQANPRAVAIRHDEIFEFTFVKEEFEFSLNFIYCPWLIDSDEMMFPFTDALQKYPSKKKIDVLLYVDRADVYRMSDSDLLIAKLITELFGISVWERALIVLTHSDAVDKFEDKDFADTRKTELLSWIVGIGCIGEVLQKRLLDEVAFVDNTKIYNSEEEITLIRKIFDIAMHKERLRVPLKPIWNWRKQDHDRFYCSILEACKRNYFERIKNGDTSIGKRQWSYSKFTLSDQIEHHIPPPEVWETSQISGGLMEKLLDKLREKARSFSIVVMGRSGVGKSSIINRIIGKDVFTINKFKVTLDVLVWSCSIDGFTLNIMETPGFVHFEDAHRHFVRAIRWFRKAYGIDALIYVDRFDDHKWDHSSMETICHIGRLFGPIIMSRVLIVLTHGKSICGEQYKPYLEKRCLEIKYQMLLVLNRFEGSFEVEGVKPIIVENGGKCGTEQDGLIELVDRLGELTIPPEVMDTWTPWRAQEAWVIVEFEMHVVILAAEKDNTKRSRAGLPDEGPMMVQHDGAQEVS